MNHVKKKRLRADDLVSSGKGNLESALGDQQRVLKARKKSANGNAR